MKLIDTIILKNIKSYLLAKLGDESAQYDMAIKYLIDGDFDKSSAYIELLKTSGFMERNPQLSSYYYHFSYYRCKNNFCIEDASSYYQKYDLNWQLTKKAINDGFFRNGGKVLALKYSRVKQNEYIDFINYVFSHIKNANSIHCIFNDRKDIFKKAIMYGYMYNYIPLEELFDYANNYEETANVFASILEIEININGVLDNNLLNIAFEIGNKYPSLCYEYGLIFLKLGLLDKAYSLLSQTEEKSANYAKAMKECGDILYTHSDDTHLAVEHYKKAVDAGDHDAKLLQNAALHKLNGATHFFADLYCETAQIENSNYKTVRVLSHHSPFETTHTSYRNTIPQTMTISRDALQDVHRDYLSHKSFFSRQSNATNKVLEKASQPDITDQKRFQILKKYVDKKSNIGRSFWSSLIVFFGQNFISSDIKEGNNTIKDKHKLKPII